MADFSEWSPEASATTASPPPPVEGSNVYVDPVNGNDSADGTTPQTARKSLQLIFNDAATMKAGVTVHLMEGTYWNTPFLAPTTNSMTYFYFEGSGVEGSPITVQAMAGHEGRVIFDGTNPSTSAKWEACGITFKTTGHVHFKNLVFKHVSSVGALNKFPRQSAGTNPRWGVGWTPTPGMVVDSCVFYDIGGTIGDGNPCGLRYDGAEGCHVTNCYMQEIYLDSPLGADKGYFMNLFTVHDALVENCTAYKLGSAIFFPKQQSCSADGLAHQIVELRYCYSENCKTLFGQNQNDYCPHGHFQIHHNMTVTKFGGKQARGVYQMQNQNNWNWEGINRQTIFGRTDVYNNLTYLWNGVGVNDYCISVHGVEAHVTGNMFLGARGGYFNRYSLVNDNEGLHYTDYNIWGTFPHDFSIAGGFNDPNKTYGSLAAWQAADPSDTYHFKNLLAGEFDPNSIVAPADSVLFTNVAQRDFTHAAGSPAIGFMPDGSNAGPYQVGDEIIGCRLPWIDLRQFWPEIPDWLNPGKDSNQ